MMQGGELEGEVTSGNRRAGLCRSLLYVRAVGGARCVHTMRTSITYFPRSIPLSRNAGARAELTFDDPSAA